MMRKRNLKETFVFLCEKGVEERPNGGKKILGMERERE